MRGGKDRECRQTGGVVVGKKAAHKNVIKEFNGAQVDNEPDADTGRSGRLTRAKGGALKAAMEGAGKPPNLGRAKRARGGATGHGSGSQAHPETGVGGTRPKGRHIMPESDKRP